MTSGSGSDQPEQTSNSGAAIGVSVGPGSTLAITGLVLALLGALCFFTGDAVPFAGLISMTAIPIGMVVGVMGIVRIVRAKPKNAPTTWQSPVGQTVDGQPIYPVVGYTADGAPVTAERTVEYVNPRTNPLAIAALVLGFVFPLAAIPVGHISRSQIRRTGEQGSGLAIAGLIFGYLSLTSLIVLGLLVATHR